MSGRTGTDTGSTGGRGDGTPLVTHRVTPSPPLPAVTAAEAGRRPYP